MMYLLLDLLNLVKDTSNRDVSVGLDFNWDLLVMNIVLGLVDLEDDWLFDDLGHLDWEHFIMVFVNDLVHVQINLFWHFDDVLNLDHFFSE
jgi:hypothetical protein